MQNQTRIKKEGGKESKENDTREDPMFFCPATGYNVARVRVHECAGPMGIKQ